MLTPLLAAFDVEACLVLWAVYFEISIPLDFKTDFIHLLIVWLVAGWLGFLNNFESFWSLMCWVLFRYFFKIEATHKLGFSRKYGKVKTGCDRFMTDVFILFVIYIFIISSLISILLMVIFANVCMRYPDVSANRVVTFNVSCYRVSLSKGKYFSK